MKTLAHINTCACFIIIKTWNNTCVYQQREKWTNKLWYIHTMEHYTAIEKRQTAASCNQMDDFHWHNDEQEKTGIMHTVWSCFIWSSKIGKWIYSGGNQKNWLPLKCWLGEGMQGPLRCCKCSLSSSRRWPPVEDVYTLMMLSFN